jgi:Uncharacterised nucleotidyltransferase
MSLMSDPEFRLIAACCRPVGQSSRRDAINAAAQAPFDAKRLVELARVHRVESLVEQGLAYAGVVLPEATAELLAQRARARRLHMLRNAGEEIRVAGLLKDSGVDAIFVKGATLAMLAHGSLAHKVSWDIDLLVDVEKIGDAIGVLRGAGYEFEYHETLADDLVHSFASRIRESSWFNAERGTTIELHWALAHNPLLLTGIGIKSSRQQVPIAGGGVVPTLADPDLFAFLAVHGTAHGWSRLKWLADIASLLDDKQESLSELLRHAEVVNAGRCAAVALLLMRDLLGVALPGELNAEIAHDRQVIRLVDHSVDAMRAVPRVDGKLDHRLSAWWMMHRSQMALAPGIRFGIAEIWVKLNQPLTSRRLRMPQWLLVPDALLISIPRALVRRVAAKLQSLRSVNTANSR